MIYCAEAMREKTETCDYIKHCMEKVQKKTGKRYL